MSMHKRDDGPDLEAALALHGLPHDTPSQLADAFRCGWDRRGDHQAALAKAAQAAQAQATQSQAADDASAATQLLAQLRAEAFMIAANVILSNPEVDDPDYKAWDGERPRICEETAYRRLKALSDKELASLPGAAS